MSWNRSKILFTLLRSELICLRGSRAKRKAQYHDIKSADIEIQNVEGAM